MDAQVDRIDKCIYNRGGHHAEAVLGGADPARERLQTALSASALQSHAQLAHLHTCMQCTHSAPAHAMNAQCTTTHVCTTHNARRDISA